MRLLLTALLLIGNIISFSQNWQLAGNAGFSAGVISHPGLAIDGGGAAYTVYSDATIGNKSTVMKLTGSAWSLVGIAGISLGAASFNAIAIDNVGAPFICYSDGGNGNKITVKRYTAAGWNTVGIAGFSAGSAQYNMIAVDNNGYPSVVFQDGANGNKLTVMRYNGTAWITLGSAGLTTGTASDCSITVDGNGVIYISFIDHSNGNKASVLKYNGTSWVAAGYTAVSSGAASGTNIKTDGIGRPYLAFRNLVDNKATVMKFTGTSWTLVGNGGISPGSADHISLAIDARGLPVISFADAAKNNRITVMKFNGWNWSTAGNSGFSISEISNSSLAIDGTGKLYVAYKDGPVATGKATVQSFSFLSCASPSQSPVPVGGPASMDGVNQPGITVDGLGTPYVAYSEVVGWSSSKGTVRKFNGTGWEELGTGFASSYIEWPSIKVDGHGTPYIAYSDQINEYKLTVKKFNGTTWDLVGPSVISDSSAHFVSLAFDGDGTPHVAYMDYAFGSKATVLKFNGTAWVPIGVKGFTPTVASEISLSINGLGQPHIAYRNHSTYKVMVMRFINGVWSALGNVGGFSMGDANDSRMVIDKKGITYVTFIDDWYGDKAVLSRNTGTGWNAVAAVYLSTGLAGHTDVAVDDNGAPYVAYIDHASAQKATLLKYNGSIWQNLGGGFSAGAANHTRITVDRAGTPYVVYQDYTNSSKAIVQSFPFSCASPATPIALNIADQCTSAPTQIAKLTNPPAGATISVTLDGSPLAYNASDSSFTYFINGTTASGSHTIVVQYANASGTAQTEYFFTVGSALIPTVNISASNNNICAGTTANFTATANNAGNNPTYQWMVNGGSVGTGSNVFSSSGLANNDQVSVMLTSNNSCASPSTATSNIIVMQVTTVTANAGIDQSICSGNSVNIGSPVIGGYTYSWTSSPAGFSSTIANPSVSPAVNTAYYLSVVANGCSAYDTVMITTGVTPSVTISASSTTPCIGSTVSFTATAVNGGASPSFQWKVNGLNVGTNNNIFTSNTLANNDVVSVIMTSSAVSCTGSQTTASNNITMTVTPKPVANAGPDQVLCPAVTSVIIGSPAVTGVSYLWSPSAGLSAANIAQPMASPATTTNYILVASSSAMCNAVDTVTVYVVTGSPAPDITIAGNVLTSNSPVGNQWYLNGLPISGATAQTYTATVTGIYTVKVTVNGCTSAFSNGISYIATSIQSPGLNNKLSIGPNPATQHLFIRYTGNEILTFRLMDIAGKKILAEGKFSATTTIDMSVFRAGTYILQLTSSRSGATVQHKIIRL